MLPTTPTVHPFRGAPIRLYRFNNPNTYSAFSLEAWQVALAAAQAGGWTPAGTERVYTKPLPAGSYCQAEGEKIDRQDALALAAGLRAFCAMTEEERAEAFAHNDARLVAWPAEGGVQFDREYSAATLEALRPIAPEGITPEEVLGVHLPNCLLEAPDGITIVGSPTEAQRKAA